MIVLSPEQALADFHRVRRDSETLAQPLAIEDYVIQSIPEVSPTKWHLAHTSWFYETFILLPLMPGYTVFNAAYTHLFNSYYQQVDKGFYPRPQRGFLSRPTVKEVYQYRTHIDAVMEDFIAQAQQLADWETISTRLVIGLHHEQQHQELMLTDIKYNFALNPLRPAYREDLPHLAAEATTPALTWHDVEAGLYNIGRQDEGFAYDNEWPRHPTYCGDFRLASRLVTNEEYLAFIEDNGYQRPELWLSDGWNHVQQHGWQAPLYWEYRDNAWWQYTLSGVQPLNLAAPVCHISYYEADAYATWADKRLPTEAEWEVVAAQTPVAGNLRDNGILHPAIAPSAPGIQQLYGDVWEWTQSPYSPYPGYKAVSGALGEYNGKFMANQFVLRGGSCVTPGDHIRASYRNFFYPHERWQFKGMRLCDEA